MQICAERSNDVQTVYTGKSGYTSKKQSVRSIRSRRSRRSRRGDRSRADTISVVPGQTNKPNVPAILMKEKNSNTLVLYGDNESQSQSYAAEEPGGVYYFDEQQSYATKPNAQAAQEPRGAYYFDDQQSYTTQPFGTPETNLHGLGGAVPNDESSFATQPLLFTEQPQHPAYLEGQSVMSQSHHSVQGAVHVPGPSDMSQSYRSAGVRGRDVIVEQGPYQMDHWDQASVQPSFVTEPPSVGGSSSIFTGSKRSGKTGDKKKKKRPSKRRTTTDRHTSERAAASGAQSQANGSDDFYYGHSNSFFV